MIIVAFVLFTLGWSRFVINTGVGGHEVEVFGMEVPGSIHYLDGARGIVLERVDSEEDELSKYARARCGQVRALVSQRKSKEALELAREVVGIDMQNAEAWGWVGTLGLHLIDGRSMVDEREIWLQVLQPLVFACSLHHRLPKPSKDPQLLLAELVQISPKPETPHSLLVYPHRLRHDISYAQFLGKEGLLPPQIVSDLVGRYSQVLNAVSCADDESYVLSRAQWELISPYYLRVLHTPLASRLRGPALNPELNFREIEDKYWASNPNFIVIDNFFSKPALEGLLRHSQQATFLSQRPTFVANFITEELGSELLAQVISEMRKKMPSLFCPQHRLYNSWEFKYDDGLSRAIEKHADAAAVNFNVWLSPDEGNLDNTTGGLNIWPVLPPPEWSWKDYNNFVDTSTLESIIQGVEPHRVAHKQNRAILFQSELIHGSQPMHWKRGYETKRINLTLLFGKKGESQICQPH